MDHRQTAETHLTAAARLAGRADADLREIIGQALIGLGNALLATAPEQPMPEILRRALAVFQATGDTRMHSAVLAQALDMTPVDLSAALREHGVTALPNPFERGGIRARGYALADLQAVTR